MSRAWTVWAFVAAMPLLGFWAYGLFDLDEGFYAAVVGDMIRRGDWIVPTIGGKPWFEKPILLYWAAIPTVQAFGPEMGARLPSVLATVGAILLGGWATARWTSVRAAPLACLALGTSLLVAAIGRMMLTDALLLLTLSGALVALYGYGTGLGSRWLVGAGASLGLAVLAKGPVAILLFGGVALFTLARERRSFLFRWSDLLGFGLALVAVVGSWYLPAYLREGDVFVQKFLIEQNVGRFTGGDNAHRVSPAWLHPIYFPVVLLLGAAPWSFQAFRRSFWVAEPGESGRWQRFLVRWFLTILVFFSISGSKLPHYIVPAAFPLALLSAQSLASGRRSFEKLQAAGAAWAVVLMGGLTAGFVAYYRSSGHAEVHALAKQALKTDPKSTLWMFQMPRREKSLGTGTMRIQETSHPSVRFVYTGDVQEGETLEGANRGDWVLTRSSRTLPDSVDGSPLRSIRDGENYRLLRIGDDNAQTSEASQ